MPRLAANLAFLFTERPLLERFGAAAAAGFSAVELQYPYEVAPAAVKAELDAPWPDATRHQYAARQRKGEFGLAALPGREQDCEAAFRAGARLCRGFGGRAIHCLAGCVPLEQRPAAEATFIAICRAPPSTPRRPACTLLIEPINPRDRPDYFLSRVEHAADIIAAVGAPNLAFSSTSITCRSWAAT